MNNAALVIGAGQAGVQVASTLRENGYDASITLAGAESHPPYSRPPLSKEFLEEAIDPTRLELRTDQFYNDQRIDVRVDDPVVDVAFVEPARPDGIATTASGAEIPFDLLAFTTGARPRRLAIPGADLRGVLYLRVIDDAIALRRELGSAERVVVVGGGFIGLEAASVAKSAGKTVTIVEALDRLAARAVAPVMSTFLYDAHTRRGVDVRLNTQVAAFEGAGRVATVRLADGSAIAADLVIVGVGILPRYELAERAGIECDGGILVDSAARTSRPGVVAAGDCTVMPNPLTGAGRVRLESTQNATAQAKVAGLSLLGLPAAHDAVPWFWSDQYDLKIQIAGLSQKYDDFVVRGEPDSEHFSVVYYSNDRLLATDAVNQMADYLAVRTALGRASTIDRVAAADAAVPLKQLIRAI
ncbi:FAD-dependent oxidoreductase [Glaciihabitans sp. UYNi722]|uniref:NAD(P)/FAD-dependent oxidoreductase n=1 Tax=Glaciihabitans sp. UYNi722 TaxID=3156344 RepID=UPI00339B10F0